MQQNNSLLTASQVDNLTHYYLLRRVLKLNLEFDVTFFYLQMVHVALCPHH